MEPEQAIHRSIMAMDIEGYSTRGNPAQSSLRAALYDLAQASTDDVGLDWSQFGVQDAGDSILLFIPSTVPPVRLVGTLVRALDDRLAERSRRTSAEYAMRLRVALHYGLVQRDRHGWSGDAVNLTTRLLDAQPLREVLSAATRARLVFIVSDDIYQDVIRHEYRSIDTAAYCPVRFDAKQMRDVVGWVFVPGYPSPPILGSGEKPGAERSSSRAQEERPAATASAPQGFNFTINGDVKGDVAGVKNIYMSGGDGATP